jgi:CheY-like chemotaxis protein
MVLAIKFGPSFVRKFVDSDNVTVKAAGFEASFQKIQVEVAAALGAAANTKNSMSHDGASVDTRSIAEDIGNALPDRNALVQLMESVILWVDDHPGNNVYERRALEAMGIRIELALSTDEAAQKVKHRSYDLIISDMGRPGDPQAGYTLLRELLDTDKETAYLIYAGSRDEQHVREAIARGALGCTNDPQELIRMVAHALTLPRTETEHRQSADRAPRSETFSSPRVGRRLRDRFLPYWAGVK